MTLILILLVCCILPCQAQLGDYMQVYEQQCLGENKMHCTDGTCIWHHQYCDGNVDCPDGSDENVCLDHTPDPRLCQETLHFLCEDKRKCIPRMLICNGSPDCGDRSDEKNCTETPMQDVLNSTCKGFKCASDNRCISSYWACDGAFDCDDRSDEDPDNCWHRSRSHHLLIEQCPIDNLNVLTHRKMYTCLDGTMCLEGHNFCDGILDCKDGSDEGDFCKNWSTMCSNNTCNEITAESTCYPDRQGPLCICHDSYYAFNVTSNRCEPLNMCAKAKPHCSQICIDKKGSFLCDCEPGYLKDGFQVGHVCMAPDPEGMMFFSTKNEIKYLALKTKKMVTVASGYKEAHGVSYDGQYLYWVETAQGHEAIVRARLENVTATRQVIISMGLEDPGDIAVDWLNNLIYFGDSLLGTISVCKADGSMCSTINTNAKLPKSLTLDVRNGNMFWADWDGKPLIMRARMDGSEPSVLVDKMDMFAAGLSVDVPGQRLFYVDTTLKGVRLDDGQVFTMFSEAIHQPYAVAAFEGTLYWSDWASNSVQATDKLTATALGSVAALDSAVYSLHIYHPILQTANTNPCIHNSCSHLCLLSSNVTSVCACPNGMALDNTGKQCQTVKNYRPLYLVVGGGTTFTRIQYNTLGNPETHATNFDIGRVQAMAYDSLRDALYIYDGQRKIISYLNMNEFSRGVTHSLLYRGLDNVVDMDYDYITDSLYILDAGRRFVEVVSLRTGKRALVHRFDNEIPLSLCVMPEHGKMLVAVMENDESSAIHIDSFDLDGAGRRHILMNDLKGPHIKLKYNHHTGKVFLADDGNSVIDVLSPQGTNRENYRELSTSITNLATTGTLVLWTDKRSSRLYWADARDLAGQTIRRFDFSIFPNATHIHIQPTAPPTEIPYHPCQTNPCSDICVQSSGADTDLVFSSKKNFTCFCPPGLLLVSNKCIELVRCKENEAYCHNSNVCIPKSKVCDKNQDCLHGEDEADCVYLPWNCLANEIMCEGKCVDRYKGCSPSTAAPTEAACLPSQFTCVSGGECVERSQMCDGVTDCADGSDEAAHMCTTLNCLHTEFMCTSGAFRCILAAFRCDGEADCYDGSDELDCLNKTCQQGYYQCRDGQCLEMRFRCDGREDCLDASDEDDCGEPDDFDVRDDVENCAEWEITCELNRTICLPFTARCNTTSECPGGTDEAGCGMGCSRGGRRCDQEAKCVAKHKLCDGIKNCADGSDETPLVCRSVNKTSTLYPIHIYPREECEEGYLCTTGKCLEWANVCDGRPDCYDGSDEGPRCAGACANHTCARTCQATPSGPRCSCPIGYSLSKDSLACLDIDECAKDVCSQQCRNVPGSFVCSCHRGYALRSDRQSCKAVRGNMSVLYVTGNSVRSITADGLIATEFNDGKVSSISDLDYDVRRSKLYVTSAEGGNLIQVNSTQGSIIITNVGKPTRVAVDWTTGNVYFADVSLSRPRPSALRVCHVERRRCARLQKLTANAEVTALVIDPAARRLFYSVTRDLESVIWSCNLSGRAVTQVAVVHNCTGLAVDSFKKKLYVAVTGPSHILAMDYEGNMFKQILADDRHIQAPHDLALFEDHIYFLVANSFKLSRCTLFKKSDRRQCELYLQKAFNANSFVLRHESVQRDDVANMCENVNCDSVCVNGDAGAVCLCDNADVSSDGKCPQVPKEELPLFNGWPASEYSTSQRVSLSAALVASVCALLVLYCAAFLYYHYVYKKRNAPVDYAPSVHFQNSMAGEGTEGLEGLSPITTPILQPAAGSSRHEFVNPLQFFRRWQPSFRRSGRPVGTAGLAIDVPHMDVSDTESDLDERENKNIISKK